MCRNIKTLFNFEPPATEAEVRDASLQFVRKLCGFTRPSKANQAAFDDAVEEISGIAQRLLGSLVDDGGAARSRDGGCTCARSIGGQVRKIARGIADGLRFMSTPLSSAVAQEFDRLSDLPDAWDFNVFHHQRLLDQLPGRMDALLDVGCGSGAFARAVAHRCNRVAGIDLSPGMIAAASRHRDTPSNIQYSVADVFVAPFKPASFDAVVTIAAVHHMDLSAALERFATLLRPGGTLLVLDLRSPSGLFDRIATIAAYVQAPLVRLWKLGRLLQSRAVRAAWAAHAAFDSYSTVPEVRALSEQLLPGSIVKRCLFWRYLLIWRRPTP